MRSLDKLITIGRLILLYESLVAGFIFIAIAVTVTLNPAMASSALQISLISEIGDLLASVMPRGNFVLIITTASLMLGVLNLSMAWVAAYVKAERRKM